jgi:peptide/nickel transport system ATP-binding protein
VTRDAIARSDDSQRGATLLDVRDLHIESRIQGRRRTIVSGLDLDVRAGECVGVVGESGSGKSLTARAITRLLPRGVFARGQVRFGGAELLSAPESELRAVRGKGISLLLQDPFTMLNPLMKVGEQITETLVTERGRRLPRGERRAEAVRRLLEVEIRDPAVADRYPFELSGGMRQRVGLAAAIAGEPRLLIADEPSTALDVTTQKEILGLLGSLQRSRGMGLILITHDLRVAFSVCDRIYVLYAGSVLEVAPGQELEREPMHPYSLGLLLSEPPAERRVQRLHSIEGSVPAPDDVADRCAFSARCRWVAPECTSGPCSLRPIEAMRQTACVRIEAIAEDLRATRAAAQIEAPAQAAGAAPAGFVSVRDVHKTFAGDGGQAVRALRGVSIEIGEGESVGIVGESGSGKTTLGRCMLGLETADSGSIEIGGIDASDYRRLSRSERQRLRRMIQVVFQDPYSSLNPVRSVGATLGEALDAGRQGAGRTSNGTSVDDLLARVGLPAHYVARKPAALSGGERQRVAIARALAMAPRILVCDEPVSALDVSVQAQILNVLNDIRAELGVAFMFITHDLSVVRQVADRIYVLHQGEVVESGPVEQVLDEPKHWYTQRLVDSIPGPPSGDVRSDVPGALRSGGDA